MATIYIRDLALRAIIGIQDWEREKQQDIIINLNMDYDSTRVADTDNIMDAVDYKVIKQKIIKLVELSRFNLLEKLAYEIVKIAMEDSKVTAACVTIDKPHALRFTRSVAVTVSAKRP